MSLSVDQLTEQLRRANDDKDALAAQHNALVAKVASIRNTLGAKLQQDAEELDRQEQLIQQLSAERDDLANTLAILQQELQASQKEAEDSQSQYSSIRARMQFAAHESLQHERDVRDLQHQLEQLKLDRDECSRAAETEKALVDDLKSQLDEARRDLDLVKGGEDAVNEALHREREKSRNLQAVLQDFQTAKDHELRQAVKDYESQLAPLAEFKSRALNAELQLEESKSTTSRAQQLEKELKEKNLLIGKLRHEAVIMNEHLIEALRRLRRSSTETKSSVDATLVTNILLQFLTTPRTDTKRFEMLTLLGSILGWGEEEREKAGLQRAGSHGMPNLGKIGFWGGGGRKSLEVDKTDETEVCLHAHIPNHFLPDHRQKSFSRLWVEFLLKESSGDSQSSSTAASLPSSPTLSPSSLRPPPTRRLASLGGMMSAAMGSTPDLVNGKGKERARE
ncbi:hypothetical protein AGABI2DRAFT_73535 [Agaricus bisporus var. bisporus H97]|uniref:hypothetical protein n=1 Tax=Agaricus bisporus var. bisporus (strain H97 / ATCC MYA-4626 / FGSC 10389) TaxID=936046 RepID=UPI00029F68F2|nr:hypothetical protein AGABI2DRAFT_73535 [Agaricus bisporus var. bisporus H97]EKV45262.1 hypothetical protein AGABI2DRAFT_73535 [Agaricus bisporus var. bisporus H97]